MNHNNYTKGFEILGIDLANLRRKYTTCPRCSQTRKKNRQRCLWVNLETGNYKCHHCGWEGRADSNAWIECNRKGNYYDSELWKTKYIPPVPKPKQYIPKEWMIRSFSQYNQNTFFLFLTSVFGMDKAKILTEQYRFGTSKMFSDHLGKSVVFWQIDINGNIRQGKVMAYDPVTGKRKKTDDGKGVISFIGRKIIQDDDARLEQCFFGEHLLTEAASKPVAIVESEKTAILMTGFFPDCIWLATGGKNGVRWSSIENIEPLIGRQVILYPDLGAYNDWEDKAHHLDNVCEYTLSTLLEDKAQGQDWNKGYDIADYFLKQRLASEQVKEDELPDGWSYHTLPGGGETLIDADGLPALWNLCPKDDKERQWIEKIAY